jgi:hypothetical protein
LNQRSGSLGSHYQSWDESEGQQKGLAVAALILGILSFFTFGLLGIGAIIGIVLAVKAMGRVRREPYRYGGRGMAIAGLVLSITSLASALPIGIIAAIAIPNLLEARRAANEGSAIYSLRQISSAEAAFQGNFGKYGTLEELAANGLIDDALGSGTKNGYRFTITLDSSNPEGFEVSGVPTEYRNTGRRSFYVDETFVIRGSDNFGGPSTKMDQPLETDSDFPRGSTRRIEYVPQP